MKLKKILIVTIICLTSNSSFASNLEKKELIIIEGIIKDSQQKKIINANILIKENEKVIAKIKSDKNGKFTVTVPKSFDYSYFIEAYKNSNNGNKLFQSLLKSFDEEQKKITVNFSGFNHLKRLN